MNLLGAFPVPNMYNDEYIKLAERLDLAREECTTFKAMFGRKVPSYNFNRRMDLLLEIDEWVVKQFTPDMFLPHGVFAQYKSSSFLESLDLSAIANSDEDDREIEE